MKKPSVMTLKRKLDKCFSKMVRERDFYMWCVSCGAKRPEQAGHFVKREILSTRWHPWNVNGECCGCNGFDTRHLIGYYKNIEIRYGVGTGELLLQLSRVRWKCLPDQLVRLIDATGDPKEYERIWFDIQNEFAPGFELARKAEA